MSQEEIIRVTVRIEQAMSQFRKLGGEIDKFRNAAQRGFVKVAGSISDLDQKFGGFGKRVLNSFPRIMSTVLSLDKKILGMGKVAVGVFGRVGGAIMSVPGRIRSLSSSLLGLSSRFQFVGFRLIAGLTLPLVRFGQASFKVAMEVEKEWVRVRKVYGDASLSVQDLAKVQKEVLQPAVMDISKSLKAHQKDIVAVMGDWAAMGKTGEELAEITKTTFEFMTLGELDAADAMTTLRMVMANFNVDVKGAKKILGQFNVIENQTSLTMKELVTAFPKVSSVFKLFNLEAREGASLLAGMHEAGIPAAEAAQALKFSLSRLQSPTSKAAAIMKQLNIEVFNTDGSMRKGTDVLMDLSKALEGSTDKTKAQAIASIFGRRQNDRMTKALVAIIEPNSAFARAMKVSADETAVATAWNKELQEVLQSQPKTWEGAKIAIENVMIAIGQKLAPVVIEIAIKLADLLNVFTNLSPGMQNVVLGFAVFLAAIGPVLFLVSQMGIVIAVLGLVFGAILTPIGLVVAAILGLAAIFGLAVLGSEGMKNDMVKAFETVKDVVIDVWENKIQPALETGKQIVEDVAKSIVDNWDNIKSAILKAWDAAKPVLNFLWNVIASLAEVIIDQLRPAWDELFAAIKPLLPIFFKLALFIGGLLLVAIVVIAGVLAGLAKAFRSFVTGVANILSGVIQIVSGVIDMIIGIMNLDWALFKEGWDSIINGIKGVFEGLWQAIAGVLGGFVIGMAEFFVNLVDRVFPGFIDSIIDWFVTLPNRVWENIKFIADQFGKLIPLILGFMANLIVGVVNWFLSLPGKIWNVIKGVAGFFWKIMKTIFGVYLPRGIARIISWFKGLPGRVWANIKRVGSFFWRMLKWVFNVLVPRGIAAIIRWFGRLPGRVWNKIKLIGGKFALLAKKAVNWGKDLITKFVEGIKNKGTWLKDQIVKLIPGPIRKVLGFSTPKEGPLKQVGKWMPHMIQLLVKTLRRSSPMLIKSVSKIASQTSAAFSPGSTLAPGGGQTLEGRPGGFGGPVFIDQSFIYQPGQSFATPEEIRNLERQLMAARRQESIRTGGE